MCGLIGAIGDQLDRDQSLDLIRHRGPDSSGWWTSSDGRHQLGHTRLAIRDLDIAAGQPFHEWETVLTYNGELWNVPALKTGPLAGRPFRTSGDTEVIAKLLSEKGPRGLDYCDGMFAVAWHDVWGHRTYLARDQWGRIPLYWCRTNDDTIMWASERKALPRGVRAHPVPPGCVIDAETFEIVHRFATGEVPLEHTAEQVRSLLFRGVQERLVSDAPVCFLSSGGLDSSLILSIARHLRPLEPLVAYTAVFDPNSADLRWARAICLDLNIELREVPVPVPTLETLTEALRVIEIPMKAQVEIALAHLPLAKQIAADGFKVCLSGEAADELFGGYGNMQIKAGRASDAEYREIKQQAVEKMARGNFIRVNKVMMAYGVEARLPFMQERLVQLALTATKDQSPPGKKLLKQAAHGLLPGALINRPKDTFQGGTGIAAAAGHLIHGNPVSAYNDLARDLFGYLPKG